MTQLRFKVANGVDEIKYPALATIIQAIVGQARWSSRPNQALLDTLHDAILRLPEKMTGRPPKKEVGTSQWRGSPERHMAELLYGYRDNEIIREPGEDAKQPLTYAKHRYRAAMKLARGIVNSSSARDITRVIREDIATELVKMQEEALANRSAPAPEISASNTHQLEPTFDTKYIYRHRLSTELMECLSTPFIRLVVLTGPAGAGKTRFIHDFVHALPAGSYLWLDASSQNRYEESIIRLLGREDPAVADLALPQLQRRLRTSLHIRRALQYVVIDGAESFERDVEPLCLLPPGEVYEPKLLVTTRDMSAPMRDDCIRLTVHGMTYAEKHALAKSISPELAEEEDRVQQELETTGDGELLDEFPFTRLFHLIFLGMDSLPGPLEAFFHFARQNPDVDFYALSQDVYEQPLALPGGLFKSLIRSVAGRRGNSQAVGCR